MNYGVAVLMRRMVPTKQQHRKGEILSELVDCYFITVASVSQQLLLIVRKAL